MTEFSELAPLWWPGMLAMGCLILASGFFSASETALFYLTRDQIRNFGSGKPRQQMVAALLSDPDRLLTAVLFWNLVINLSYFAISVVIAHRLSAAGQNAAAGLYGLMSLFSMILLGEVCPKSFAVAFRVKLAPLVSWPLAIAVRTLDPIIPILGQIARMLRRTFWPDIQPEPYLRPEDLEQAVETNSATSKTVVKFERDILHNILDLSEIKAEEVMRPRGLFTVAKRPVNLQQLNGELPEIDYVVIQDEGEVVSKSIALGNLSFFANDDLESTAENVAHVPWCADLAHVLQLMRDRFVNVAVVVNEYGESIGIVTYDDVIDTIILPQASRTRRVLGREPVLEVDSGRYHVDGITTLRYLGKRLDTEFDPGPDNLMTVAGLLHEQLERIPDIGDECVWHGHSFRVISVNKKGGLRAMVWAGTPSDTEAEQ
jgi:putative hemolysin